MDNQTDTYPSRGTDTVGTIERAEPVVYPGDSQESGPLDSQALQTFEEKGFLFLDSLFGAEEVAAMQIEMEALRANEKVRQSEMAVTEALSGEIRSVFAVHTVSKMLESLASDRRLLGLVRQILGSEVYLHQSRANYKPGFRGKEYYWHSDFETWHCEDGMPTMRAVSCSVLLSPSHAQNGPLMVFPGSHRYFFQCEGQTPDDHYLQSLKKQDYGVPSDDQLIWMEKEFGIDVPLGPVGSVLLCDCNLMHGSNSNITPYPRSNVVFSYNSMENLLQEPFAAEQHRPWYLGNPEPVSLQPADLALSEVSAV